MATTCTEPAAIAFASCQALNGIGGRPSRIELKVSPGVLKNCLFVGLPCTSKTGPEMAAALGVLGGKPDLGLEVLRDIGPRHVEEALRFVGNGNVLIECDPSQAGVFVKASVTTDAGSASVTLKGSHSVVAEMTVDGVTVIRNGASDYSMNGLRGLTFDDLLDVAFTVNADEIDFLVDGSRSAVSLGRMDHDATGFPLRDGVISSRGRTVSDAPVAEIRRMVTAAVLSRMQGRVWPVLTSGGSGNQGIMTGLAIIHMGEEIGADRTTLSRALFVAHLINLYIKAFSGKISLFCGAVPAGAGVAASTCWLSGGTTPQMQGAIHSVLATLYGMLCDGAKGSCALKCAVGAAEGVMAGLAALDDCYPRAGEGIVGASLEATVKRLEGIQTTTSETNRVLIESMGLAR